MKYKIKSNEAIALLVNLICSKMFLLSPSHFKTTAQSGSLIMVCYFFIIGTFLLFVNSKFAGKYNFDLLSALRSKALKSFSGIIICLSLLFVTGIVLSQYTSSVNALFFSKTPYIFISAAFTLTMLLGAYGYLCGLSKANSFFVPIIYVITVAVLLFTFRRGNFYYLFPVLGNGLTAIFGKGFFMLSSFFELIVLFFLPPILDKPADFTKIAMKTMLFSFIIYFIVTLSCLITFYGALPDGSFSPLFLILRQIKIGTYFQHPDTVFMLLYLLSAFLYLSTMLFFTCRVFQNSFGIKTVKPMLIPFTLIIFLISQANAWSSFSINSAFYTNLFFWIIPFVLPPFLYGLRRIK